MEALGLQTLPQYSVQAVPRTQLMEVIVLDTNPERSQAVANELSNQLIKYSPSGASEEDVERQEFINEQLDDLQIQIDQTKAEIEAKQQELGGLFSAQQINEAQQELTALNNKLNTLTANFTALLANTQEDATNALSVIEPARLPRAPVDSKIEITVLTAAAIGFAVAVAAAYLLEFLDDRVKSVDYIKANYKIPVLGALSTIKETADTNGLITISRPRSADSESFRALRTNIQVAIKNQERNTILITSSTAGEGKSHVAANLAVVMTQGGNKVLLIDADLHRPSQDSIFNLPQHTGLSTALNPHNRWLALRREDGVGSEFDRYIHTLKLTRNRLSVMTSGPVPNMPAELLSSSQMRDLLSRVSQAYDYVLVDSPPVLATSDAAILGTMVDSIILVVDMGQTRRDYLKHAIEHLGEVGAPVSGLILNRLKPNAAGNSYGYYHRQTEYLQPQIVEEVEDRKGTGLQGTLDNSSALSRVLSHSSRQE
jgi:non-specific protein-tyrosine kinase